MGNTVAITCSACDFVANSSALLGQFFYKLGGREPVQIPVDEVWCFHCQTIAVAEASELQINDRMQQMQVDIQNVKEELRAIRKNYSLFRWLFPRNEPVTKFVTLASGEKLGCPSRSPIVVLRERRRLLLEDQLHLRDVREIARQRKMRPRCLACGGVEHQPINIPFIDDHQTPQYIGFDHPKCGGRLMVRGTSLRIHFSIPTRYYDEQGLFLSGEPLL